MAVSCIYSGFHNYPTLGMGLVYSVGILMSLNLFLQMTPCYMQDKYDKVRLLFYVTLITLLFGVAIFWTFFTATSMEIEIYFGKLMLSFLYIGIGFFFYITGYPERLTNNYYIQIIFGSHVWWHIFVFLNTYSLYWILYYGLIHFEAYPTLELELLAIQNKWVNLLLNISWYCIKF